MADSDGFKTKLTKRTVRADSSAAEVAQNDLTISVRCESKHTAEQLHADVGAEEQLEEQMAAWESEGGHLAFPSY